MKQKKVAQVDKTCEAYILRHLKRLTPFFAKVIIGDFTPAFEIPKKNDLFSSIYAGIKLLYEVAKEKITDLEREQKKLSLILENIGDGLIVTDKVGRIVLVNSVAVELFKWKRAQIIGTEFVHSIASVEDTRGQTIPLEKRPIYSVLVTGRKFSSTIISPLIYVRKDGTKFTAAVTVTPIIFNKKIMGTIMVCRDITKESELDRTKTEFITLASHHLRTPPTAIKWYLESFREKYSSEFKENQWQLFNEIERANSNMIMLINSLLSVSKLEVGLIHIEPKPTDIVELMRATLSGFQSQILDKKLNVRETFERVSPLMVDPTVMHIIFQTVLANAVAYTLEGGSITIKISQRRKKIPNLGHAKNMSGKREVLISISDTGCGIPKEQQGRVFTKLFRGDNAQLIDPSGIGLGLYSAKLMIDAMHGKIWFESVEKKGSTFYILIPFEEAKL